MAGVVRQATHAPFLEWGSSVASWERILVPDDEAEEAVEPSLALSSTGFYGSTLLFHGWSICFQNYTIYPYVVLCKVVGFA